MNEIDHHRRRQKQCKCSVPMVLGVIGIYGILGVLIGIAAGGYPVSSQMNVMTKVMKKMDIQMDEGSGAIKNFGITMKDKFPSNQMEVFIKQIVGIVDDTKHISARTQYLLNNVKGESLGSLMDRINIILKTTTKDDLMNIKQHIMGIMEHADDIVKNISPTNVANLIAAVASLNISNVNNVLANAAKIHELKIQF